MGDAPGRTAARDLAQVDAGLPRPQPHGRRGQRLFALWARRAERVLAPGGRFGRCLDRGFERRFRRRRSRLPGRRSLFPGFGWGGVGGLLLGFRRSGCEPCPRLNLQPDQRRADRDGVADLGAEPEDFAVDRRGDFDGRLVGHDRGEHRVLAHEVADLDVPFDEFGLGDAFADIGQLDDVFAHDQASIVSRRARPTRAGPGK